MKPIVFEREIGAPVERVFTVLTDIPNAAERLEGITSIEMLSEGPVGVGTRWKETRLMFGKESTEEMWITEFVPNEMYAVEANSCGCLYRSEFHFAPRGECTGVRASFAAEAQTLFAKVMHLVTWPMIRTTIEKCFAQDLADAAAVCESELAV